MSNRFKRLAVTALSFLSAVGWVHAQTAELFNEFTVFEDEITTNVIIEGRDQVPAQTDGFVWNWAATDTSTISDGQLLNITNIPPMINGQIVMTPYAASSVLVEPAGAADLWINAVNPGDYSSYMKLWTASIRDPLWGSHFMYAPPTNWYGKATFQAIGDNSNATDAKTYSTKSFINVLNMQDLPEVIDNPRIFILKCLAKDTCSATNGCTDINAFDMDITAGDHTAGLVYQFPTNNYMYPAGVTLDAATGRMMFDGQGYAEITNNRVCFTVTNTNGEFSVNVPVRIVDTIAWYFDTDSNGDGILDTHSNMLENVEANYEINTNYWNLAHPGNPIDTKFANDNIVYQVPVRYGQKNGPYFTDVTAQLAHNDLNADHYNLEKDLGFVEFFEGEAIRFSLTANDNETNNSMQKLMSCYDVTKVIWSVRPSDKYPNADGTIATGIVQEVIGSVDVTNGVKAISSSFMIDTSSESFTNKFGQLTVKVDAIDICGVTNTFTWCVVIRPTLEYPLIDMPEIANQPLGGTFTVTANELNGNNQFIQLTINGEPLTIGGYAGGLTNIAYNASNGTYTFRALWTGPVDIRATVRYSNNNAQVMAGFAHQVFTVLIPASMLKTSSNTRVISGNDTNAFCYGRVNIVPKDTNGVVWVEGVEYYLPGANVTFLAIASTTPEGAAYTFLHWGTIGLYGMTNWVGGNYAYNVFQNPTNEFRGSLFGRYTTNEVVNLPGVVAVFKLTSLIPAPLVNNKPDMIDVENSYLAFQGEAVGYTNQTDKFSTSFEVQSECLPSLVVEGLPEGYMIEPGYLPNYRGSASNNFSVFCPSLLTTKIPTVLAVYSNITLYVQNAAGRLLIGTFTLTEMPPPPPPAWLDPNAVTTTTISTFNGWAREEQWHHYEGDSGSASMTVTLRPGKDAAITGKFMLNAQSHTFTATGCTYSGHGDMYEIEARYNWGTEARRITLRVAGDQVWGDDSGFKLALYRNAFTGATPVDGYYTMTMPSLDGVAGSGYITLTVGAKGAIKGAGRLGDGTTRSFSTTLVAVPQWYKDVLTGDWETTNSQYVAVIEALPASYKRTRASLALVDDFNDEIAQGYLFGIVEFYKDPVQGKTVIRLFEEREPIEWVNCFEKATSSYGEGFKRALGVSGGFYNKTQDLKAYYSTIKVGQLPTVAELPFTYKNGTVNEPATAQATYWNPGGLTLAALVAPKADTPKKISGALWPDDTYDYTSAAVAGPDLILNSTGLKFGYTQATGLFRGTFNVYYDYVTAVNETTGASTMKHTAKKVTYQGIFLPVRADLDDGFEGRGFFLMGDKTSYDHVVTGKPVAYNFNWSYDFSLTK